MVKHLKVVYKSLLKFSSKNLQCKDLIFWREITFEAMIVPLHPWSGFFEEEPTLSYAVETSHKAVQATVDSFEVIEGFLFFIVCRRTIGLFWLT